MKTTEAREITVTLTIWSPVRHGYSTKCKTRKFKTLKGAREYAQKCIGAHPEISVSGYAVGMYGDAKITARGATLEELFPERE